jgi:hypothetical protein
MGPPTLRYQGNVDGPCFSFRFYPATAYETTQSAILHQQTRLAAGSGPTSVIGFSIATCRFAVTDLRLRDD